MHVPLPQPERVIEVLSACRPGFSGAGFFCLTATRILKVEKAGVSPQVLFEAAAGTNIVRAFWKIDNGESRTGLQALIITSDGKIFSTGGLKTSMLDKRDAAILGERQDYGSWVCPISPLLQLNLVPMALLPAGEVMVDIEAPALGSLGEPSLGEPTIKTRSPTGLMGKLSTSRDDQGERRFGIWSFTRS